MIWYSNLYREDEIKAAIIIAQASRIIVDDIMNNHSIEFRKFIDELMNKKDQVVRYKIADNSLVVVNNKEIKKIDPVEEAISRIDNEARKRRDKRKIVEQYSLIEKPWGVLDRYDIRRKAVRKREDQHNKVILAFQNGLDIQL